MTKQKEIVELAKKLISFKTTANNPRALLEAVDFIGNYFNNSKVNIRRFNQNGKPSLLINLGSENAEILFNGHVDVVAGSKEQFTPKIKGNRLFGRGALDMKGGLATLLVLVKELSERKIKPRVGLSVVTDEEIGGKNGTGFLVEGAPKPKFFLSAEPTDLQIGNEARGIIWLKIKALGKSAHASTPWLGENANVKLINYLGKINRRFPTQPKEEWVTTRNLSVINGGDTVNKVPDVAEARFDIRYIPTDDPKNIIDGMKKLISDGELEVENLEPAAYANPGDRYIVKLSKALNRNGIKPNFIKKFAASDARFYTKMSTPAVVFGPSGQGQHADSEYVDINSLETLYKTLKTFVDLDS